MKFYRKGLIATVAAAMTLSMVIPCIGEVAGPQPQNDATEEKDIETIDREAAAAAAAAQDGGAFADSSAEEETGTLSPPSSEEETGTLSQPGGDSVFAGSSSGGGETAVSSDELDGLMSNLKTSMDSMSGTWSVFVCDLSSGAENCAASGAELGMCARQQAASLVKLYIMGAVYENYDSLSANYSDVDSLLYNMITVSDNDASNTLVSYLGGGDSSAGMGVVNSFCQSHGFTQSSMGRLLLQSNEFGDNYTSVADCGHLLREVYKGYKGEQSSLAHAADMFNLLSQQQRRNKIPSQMPDGVSVANKTGELDTVENDAGIVYNVSRDLVIVFMSENLGDVGAAQYSIASMSRSIYDYFNG